MICYDDIRTIRYALFPLYMLEVETQQLKNLAPGNEQFKCNSLVALFVKERDDQRVINDRCDNENNSDVQFPDQAQYSYYQFHPLKIQNKHYCEHLPFLDKSLIS